MIRGLALLAALAALAAGGFLIYRNLMMGPPVVLPPPTQLSVNTGARSLSPGGWTNSSSLVLSATGARSTVAGMDVEIRHEGQRFDDAPTASVAAASSVPGGDPPIRVHLANGSYHWQARLHNGSGVSPWVRYRHVIRIDTVPPIAPAISSTTDPSPHKTYHSSTLQFSWTDSDTGSGIEGYSYRLDSDPKGVARTEVRTGGTSIKLVGLNTGVWYLHVRALDHAGNWGASATFPVHIDVTPPGLASVRFSQFQFDPQFDRLRVSFAVTKPSSTVRVGVYRQSDERLMRLYTLTNIAKGQAASVAWDGKDTWGRPVGPGMYEIFIRATDRYGHSSVQGWRDFAVDYQRILISLSQQKLWAYDGNQVFLTSLVATGNRALPTPTGIFHILGKFHPFTFRSPWPKSSPYYYPPSPTQWAMLFREGGYFIHDAPWRSAFGPGTNAQLGKPGQNYTGTHGCVNVPTDVAKRLFAWAQIGTVFQVVS